MVLCTSSIAKLANNLHELPDAGTRRRNHILANATPTQRRVLGVVVQLLLDQKIGVPAEHADEANENIEDTLEIAKAV